MNPPKNVRDKVLVKFGQWLCRKWNIGRRYEDQVYAFSMVTVAEHTYLNHSHNAHRVYDTPQAPLFVQWGGEIDFVCLVATIPWTCIGGNTSSQSQGKCRATVQIV